MCYNQYNIIRYISLFVDTGAKYLIELTTVHCDVEDNEYIGVTVCVA